VTLLQFKRIKKNPENVLTQMAPMWRQVR